MITMGERFTGNDPTTGELIMALRNCCGTECSECVCNSTGTDMPLCGAQYIADRLERQEQTIAELVEGRSHMVNATAELTVKVGELTARAEQAEKELKAAEYYLEDYKKRLPWIKAKGGDKFLKVESFDPEGVAVMARDVIDGLAAHRFALYGEIEGWRGSEGEKEKV